MDTILGLVADQPFWIWAGLAAALLAAEVATGSGWLLWATASAGVRTLAALSVTCRPEWAAELDDGEVLEAGASVEVVGVQGGCLKVRRA